MAEAGPAAASKGLSRRRQRAEALLLQDIARLRRRVCWQRAGLTALRVASGLGLALTLVWALALPVGYPLLTAALAALLVLACIVAAIRRPGNEEVARLVDRRLGLQARVATALEVVEAGAEGYLPDRQVLDTWVRLAGVEPSFVFPLRLSRRDRRYVAAVAIVAAAAVGARSLAALSPLGQPSSQTVWRGPEDAALAGVGALGEAALLDEPARGRADADRSARGEAAAQRAGAQQLVGRADLRVTLQETAAERVARALGGIAATRAAAESLRAGDYPGAAAALASLAEQFRQLSPDARAEVARALRDAAGDLASGDPALARSLQAASQALLGDDSQAVQVALRDLAESLARAGEQASRAEPLAQADGTDGPRRSPGGRDERAGGVPGSMPGGGQGNGLPGAMERGAGFPGSGGAGQRVVDPLSGPPEPPGGAPNRALAVSGGAGPAAPRITGVQQGVPVGSGAGSAPPTGGSGARSAFVGAGPSQYVPWEAKPLVRDYFSWDQWGVGGR